MIMIDFSKCYFFEDKSPRRSTEKRSLRALLSRALQPFLLARLSVFPDRKGFSDSENILIPKSVD